METSSKCSGTMEATGWKGFVCLRHVKVGTAGSAVDNAVGSLVLPFLLVFDLPSHAGLPLFLLWLSPG